MTNYPTIFVVRQEDGKIEERLLVAQKNGRCFTLPKETSPNAQSRKVGFPETWCFDSLKAAEDFVEGYSLQMKKQVHQLDVLQDMFDAWADEYSDEKDFFQKKALVDFLKEEMHICVNLHHKSKLHHWEYDAKDFRDSKITQ